MSTDDISLPPVLREGDRLTASEFLRRWEAITQGAGRRRMPDLKHAELIDGVVFLGSLATSDHGERHASLCRWIWLYAEQTIGCRASRATLVVCPNDVVQPDGMLLILPEYGGQSNVTGEYLGGGPELIVEVTGSSSSRDLGVKLELYRRSGVLEYLTILLKPNRVIWRQLMSGRHREITPDDDGLLRSRTFPGLWLDPDAVWDQKRSLETALEQGVRSPEHAAFVRRLSNPKR